MKYIYFEDNEKKEKILKDGISLRPNQRKINKESSGIFCYPLIKIHFKAPFFDENDEDYLTIKQKEQFLNDSLTIEEAWGNVGLPRVKRDNKKVKKFIGIIFELEPKHWPITVLINIQSFIANEFANLIAKNSNITYLGSQKSFFDLVNDLKLERYVIENAPFNIKNEIDLIEFINMFQKVGGIWGEDSFEFMLIEEISNYQIHDIIEIKAYLF